MRFIEHIIEPDRLLLTWQAPDGPDRMRRSVAELVRRGDDADLVYLVDTEDFREAKSKGFDEYPGCPIFLPEHTKVLSIFMKRLPPRSRRDFDKFLASIRIAPKAVISDFALLGYSGAKLPDDDFTIVAPFSSAKPPFEVLLYVQGYRYRKEQLPCDRLIPGARAEFEPEPDNEQDPGAVRVVIDGKKAGYVSRGLAGQMQQWMLNGYTLDATLERINGTPEKPSLFLFLSVRNSIA